MEGRIESEVASVKQLLGLAGLGVTEKALVVANSLWKVRQEMFTQVYWHHTVRSLKSMLGYRVSRSWPAQPPDENLNRHLVTRLIAATEVARSL